MELTKPQKSILNMESFAGGAISNVCGSMLLSCRKPVNEMKKTINEIYRINDALRIRIIRTGEETKQIIVPYEEQNITVLSFDNKSALDSYSSEYAKQPFDLHESLCEINIVMLPECSGVLVKFHHIIGDAWTISLIGTQFIDLLDNKKIQSYSYIEYVQAEKNYLSGERYKKDRDFFISEFSKCNESTYIFASDSHSFKADRASFLIDKNEYSDIFSFAADNNASVFTLFMTALAAYMSRINMNTEKVYIGTTVLNRNGVREKNTMGLFVNTIPLLLNTDNDKTFIDTVDGTEVQILSSLRHQKYNYSDLIEELRTDYHFSGKLYDVILSYQNAKITGDNIETTWYHNGMQAESLQIHVDDRDNDGILKINYDYQTDKFSLHDIEILHENICKLLFFALKDKHKKLSELEILSNEDKHKLLYGFNDTKTEYNIPENSTLYSLFANTAEKMPQKICITANDKSITFGELLKSAEALDSKIQKITDNKKSVVAVIAQRSIEMYTAIYGIIRGGNAYLPISPDYPEERIKYILNDSSVSLVIAQSEFISLSGDTPSINITEFIENPDEYDTLLSCRAVPDDTAYIIYTSGSTGQPKGAMISNKSAINRILWMQEKYPLDSNSVILQKTPFTFDVSVWELFWWGLGGGKLAASKPGEHFLPTKILDETEKNRVTHLHFVPSVFDIFLTYLENHDDRRCQFNSVKHIFLSGEVLNASLIRRFYNMFDGEKFKLHNLYGPTECTVDVTYYDCKPDDIDIVPIGKPINNTSIYITDKYLNIVPIGTKGELCIGGVNVGKGYINRPELTEEKFIPNPFGEGKLYKTGDIACRREDGQIVFIGRMDGQIKFNGQRIETEEIESVIKNVPEVDAAFVVFRKINSQNMLAAFYCGQENCENMILECCKKKLPSYMIPSAIHHLDKLPLNPSGKLDRKFLNNIEIKISKNETAEPPRNKTENTICNLFEKVLHVSEINRNSDFFDSGGTSISMISILSKDLFSGISAADFIANPTPSKLAKLINNSKNQSFTYMETLLHTEDSKKSLVLFPFAGGGVESFANLVNSVSRKSTDISIYYVGYLHSESECEAAAMEISELCDDTDVYFYSHCVGSAVGMQILNCLEKKGCDNIKHFIAGASIPSKNLTKKNIWNFVPDALLKKTLITAGANFENLSDEKITEFINKFRNDTDFATWYFSKNKTVSECPFTVVINKKDIFTMNYKKAEKMWNRYVTKVKDIHFIDSETHYFQSENSDELADIIISVMQL